MLELYTNIRKARLDAGMTQAELAKRAGYTDRSSIAKIEKGMIDIPQSKIEIIAEALGVSARDLMGYDGTTDSPNYYKNISPHARIHCMRGACLHGRAARFLCQGRCQDKG